MDQFIRKVLGAVAGVAICIAVWSIQDRLTGGGDSSSDSIPAVVWGGGAGTITVEVEASEPAIFAASFESDRPIDSDHGLIESWQKIPAGKSSFDIDVPAGVSGTIEVRIDEPSVGADLKIVLRANGKWIAEDAQHLDKPLDDGYGFFAQIEVADYARGSLADEGFFD